MSKLFRLVRRTALDYKFVEWLTMNSLTVLKVKHRGVTIEVAAMYVIKKVPVGHRMYRLVTFSVANGVEFY